MAQTTIVSLINEVKGILHDDNSRWLNADLLSYYVAAIREIALYRPDAVSVVTWFKCKPQCMQTLADGDLRLLDVICDRAGNTVTSIDRETLDALAPGWRSTDEVSDEVEHYVYDDRYPQQFWVYPCPAASVELQIVVPRIPAPPVITDFSGDTTTIGVKDSYANAVVSYMLYRCFLKDSRAGNSNKAVMHRQLFDQALGIKSRVDAATSPAKKEGAE